MAALRVGDVFDAQGKPKDTIYLSAAQTKGNDSCTVLANKRLRTQLTKYAEIDAHQCSLYSFA